MSKPLAPLVPSVFTIDNNSNVSVTFWLSLNVDRRVVALAARAVVEVAVGHFVGRVPRVGSGVARPRSRRPTWLSGPACSRKKRVLSTLLLFSFGLDTAAFGGVRAAPLVVAPAAVQAEAPASRRLPGEPVDLRTWMDEGRASGARWSVAGDGTFALLGEDGPAFLVSPDERVNATIRGRVRVVSSGAGGGRAGLLIGYASPLRERGDDPAQAAFLLVDWPSDDDGSPRLASLSRVEGLVSDRALVEHTEPLRVLRSAELPAVDASAGVHSFEISYRRSRVALIFDGTRVLDVRGSFSEGHIGLYAARAAVRFEGLTVGASNAAPVADAGPDIAATVSAGCAASVTLDGTRSSDPDGDSLSYSWEGPFGTAEGPRPIVSVPVGDHAVTLRVLDGNGEGSSARVGVVVGNREHAGLLCPSAVTATANPGHMRAAALALGAPRDADGCPVPAAANDAPAEFAVGTTAVTWTGPDGSVCIQAVTLLAASTPAVSASVERAQLWPPNGKMSDVGLHVVATDPSGATPGVSVAVYSDETDESGGHGGPDAEVEETRLLLRAERDPHSDGRVYLVIATAQNDAGATATSCATVTVPHDQSASSIASVIAQAAAAQSQCAASGEAPAGYVLLAQGPFTACTPREAVRPLLECLQPKPDGTFDAVFGYRNDNPVPVTVAIGADNAISPAPIDRGQPTSFAPGRTPADQGAFTVPYAGTGTLAWALRGPDLVARSAAVSASTPTCPVPPQTPQPQPDSATTAEATPVTIPVLANDVSPLGYTLVVARVTQGAHGTVAFEPDGTVTYSPEAGFVGTDGFTYTVSDSHVGTGQADVTVTVTGTSNQPPVVEAGPGVTIALPTSTVALSGSVSDDGLPSPPAAVTVQWSGPAGVAFADPSSASTTATVSQAGTHVLTLTASDSELQSSASTRISVTPPNQPPVVDAGPAQRITLPTNSVALNGTATDDGLPDPPAALTLSWSQVGGPGTITFADPSSATSTATLDAPGVYVLRLTADDGQLAASSDVVVTVSAANQPPLVGTGPNRAVNLPAAGGPVSVPLSGSASDDGLPDPPAALATEWSQVSGPGAVALADASQAATTASFDTEGTYVLRLSASDSALVASETLSITVSSPGPENQPPAVDAGPNLAITLPTDTVALNGSGSDDGLPNPPAALAFSWRQTSGPPGVSFTDPTLATTQARFPGTGSYGLQLTASDGELSSTAGVIVTVNPVGFGNQPPAVSAGPNQTLALPATTVALAGTATDDGLPDPPAALTLSWTEVSGPGPVSFASPGAASTSASLQGGAGTYVLRLTASDSLVSSSAQVTVTLTPENQAPTVSAGPNRQITLPETTVALAGTASDDGLPSPPGALALSWTEVSGPAPVAFSSPTAAATDATFTAPGSYVLRLTASDSQLETSSDATVTVVAVNRPPAVSAGPDQTLALPDVPSAGRVLLVNDEWPLSDWGFILVPDMARFAENVAAWFTGGGPGSFLVYSTNFSLTQASLRTAMTAAGHTWTIDPDPQHFTLAELSKYDGVFLAGNPADNQILIDYVNGGGNVYLAGGTGVGGAVAEAAQWNTFLNAFGLAFEPQYVANQIYPLSGTHPLLSGVTSIYYSGGNPISVLDPSDPRTQVLHSVAGLGNLMAVFDGRSSSQSVTATLAGTAADDGLPSPPGALAFSWTKVSGPGPVVFANPTAASTTATMSVAGPYVLRLTASDSVLSSSSDVTITVTPAARPLTVNSGPNQTVSLPTTTVTLSGSVTEDPLPAGATLSATWSQLSGPGGVSFADPASPQTTATLEGGVGTYVLRLTGTDGTVTATSDVTITLTPENQTPVVSAGTDQTISLPAEAALQGQATDDGLPVGILSSTWTQVSGPAPVSLFNPSALLTTATFSEPGTYVMRLTADDTVAASSSEVTISVLPPGPKNEPPTVSAGLSQTITLPTDTVTLEGSASDDGLPDPPGSLSLQWSQVSGPAAVTFADAASAVTSASFPQAGAYVLELRASDSQLWSASTVTVTVDPEPPANQAPLVSAGSGQTVTLPTSIVTLAGSATDDGLPSPPGVLTLQWSKRSGPGLVTFSSPASPMTDASFSTAGTYVLQLSASDSALSTSSTVTVTVVQPGVNRPPVVGAGPDRLITPPTSTVTLSGSATDDGLPNPPGRVSVQWSQVSGPGAVGFTDPASATTAVTFPAPGSYILQLTASDSEQAASATTTVTVAQQGVNQAPVVSAGPDRVIMLPASAVTLVGTAGDDGLPNPPGSLSLQWSQVSGPGTVAFASPASATTQASFGAAGSYVLRLSASDSELSASSTVTVTVLPAGTNHAPAVSAGPNQTIVLPTSTATLTGSVTDDGLPSPPGRWRCCGARRAARPRSPSRAPARLSRR